MGRATSAWLPLFAPRSNLPTTAAAPSPPRACASDTQSMAGDPRSVSARAALPLLHSQGARRSGWAHRANVARLGGVRWAQPVAVQVLAVPDCGALGHRVVCIPCLHSLPHSLHALWCTFSPSRAQMCSVPTK